MPERDLESPKEKKSMFYVGIDWATDSHDVAVVNDLGKKIQAFRIPQSGEGFHLLRDKLRSFGVPNPEILIGIETSKLALVDFLLHEGFTVYPINPKAISRFRDRYTASSSKSDSFDAEVIAQALRTDRDRFQPFVPDSPLLRELRILVHDQQRLIRMRSRLLNQLAACLKDYYPAALELFEDFNSSVALDFLKQYPRWTPITARQCEKFLRRHHYPSPEEKAQQMTAKLSATQIFIEDFTVRAKSQMLLALIEQLQPLRERIQSYQKQIDELFDQHPDSHIFRSLPGAGEKNAPRLLTEIGDNRERYSGADSLQCQAGTSPITRASGRSRIVSVRRSCRKTFRDTMHQFSFCSITQSSWAKTLYVQKKAQGRSHAAALRVVGDKWLKIIYRLWKEKACYDENIYLAGRMRHQLQQAATA